MSPFSALGGQSIGTSASASVFPMNIQGWFPLGLTGLISLQARGLSEPSPAPQFENISSLALSLLYGPTLTSVHNYWKNHSSDYMNLCQRSHVAVFSYTFELWCWRRLLRIPWITRWSNQSILKEINPEYSLERLMLKLKFQYFDHLIWRVKSFQRPWCWERLKAKGEEGGRGWAG